MESKEKALELEIDRICEIDRGLDIIGDNRYLSGQMSIELSLLKKRSKPIRKAFEKAVEKLTQVNLIPESYERNQRFAIEAANRVQQEIDKMKSMKRKIKVPMLLYSEFEAKEDSRRVIEYMGDDRMKKSKEELVRKGQSLVPFEFFSLMGNLIVRSEDEFNKLGNEEEEELDLLKGIEINSIKKMLEEKAAPQQVSEEKLKEKSTEIPLTNANSSTGIEENPGHAPGEAV